MKKFNLNEYIYVQITDYGREYLEKHYPEDFITQCIDDYKTEIDGEIWWKLQAYSIAEYFGNALWIASSHPIKPNILVSES